MPISRDTCASYGVIQIDHRTSASVLAAERQLFQSHSQVHTPQEDAILTPRDGLRALGTPDEANSAKPTIQPSLRTSLLFSSSRRKNSRRASTNSRRASVNSERPKSSPFGHSNMATPQTPGPDAPDEPKKSRWARMTNYVEKSVIKGVTTFCR